MKKVWQISKQENGSLTSLEGLNYGYKGSPQLRFKEVHEFFGGYLVKFEDNMWGFLDAYTYGPRLIGKKCHGDRWYKNKAFLEYPVKYFMKKANDLDPRTTQQKLDDIFCCQVDARELFTGGYDAFVTKCVKEKLRQTQVRSLGETENLPSDQLNIVEFIKCYRAQNEAKVNNNSYTNY